MTNAAWPLYRYSHNLSDAARDEMVAQMRRYSDRLADWCTALPDSDREAQLCAKEVARAMGVTADTVRVWAVDGLRNVFTGARIKMPCLIMGQMGMHVAFIFHWDDVFEFLDNLTQPMI